MSSKTWYVCARDLGAMRLAREFLGVALLDQTRSYVTMQLRLICKDSICEFDSVKGTKNSECGAWKSGAQASPKRKKREVRARRKMSVHGRYGFEY